MNFRAWTPRYFLNRIKVAVHQQLHRNEPWLTADSVDFLSKHLQPTDSGLEWGSGQSTLWFAKKVGALISIETAPLWHKIISNKITEEGIYNIILKITDGDTHSELLKQVSDIAYESIDFVLVDGAVNRHITAEISIPLLKAGGMLIIDNINWYMPSPYGYAPDSVTEIKPEWATVHEIVQDWKCHWTTDGVTDTAIWFKP